MKKLSKKDINADLKEYSNQATKDANNYIITHGDVMHIVIDLAKKAAFEDELAGFLKDSLSGLFNEFGIDTDDILWFELGQAFYTSVKGGEDVQREFQGKEPLVEFDIEKLPMLDKKKKIDELLENLSKETDPQKQEKIKQHIERIKRAKLIQAGTTIDDPTPYQKAEERGQLPPSKDAPESQFLSQLIEVVLKAGVSIHAIKRILETYGPITTLDDVGNVAAKIWTVATEKYGVKREWLRKQLSEEKLKKKTSSIVQADDKWQKQKQVVPFGYAAPGTIAYEPYKKGAVEDNDTRKAILWDHVKDSFFEKGNRWSSVIKQLKDLYPDTTQEDIAELLNHVKHYLEQYKLQVQSKKEGLSLQDALTYFSQNKTDKGHVVHVDLKEHKVHWENGSTTDFDETVNIAHELMKQSSEFGFLDGPKDIGKNPSGDFPSVSWLPKGHEDEWLSTNVRSSSLTKKADKLLSTEDLDLYAENERDLYDAFIGIVDILKEMLVDNSYDPKQALQYWIEWYTEAGNKYEHEFPEYVVSTRAIQEASAKQEPYVKQQILNGEYGDIKAPVQKVLDIKKLPVMDVEKAKDDLLDQLAKETDPEKKKSLERRYKHLTMASLKKQARIGMPYWIDSSGKEYELKQDTHATWAERNSKFLKDKYGIDLSKTSKIDSVLNYLIDLGWTRAEVGDTEIFLDTGSFDKTEHLDNFIAKHWSPKEHLLRYEVGRDAISIDDPFPNLKSAIEKAKHSPVAAKAAKSPLSEEVQNEIAAQYGVAVNTALTLFNEAVSGGHPRDRAFEYALDAIEKMHLKVSLRDLLSAIKTYLK